MKGLYSSPFRVYICLAALAAAGMVAGMRLPVSLFPNSSKPKIRVNISYGSSTAAEFLDVYGRNLEGVLQGITTDNVEVEKVESNYDIRDVTYNVYFKWGAPPRIALREVQNAVNAYAARFPVEIRDSVNVGGNNDNGGFLAVSFYSSTRSLDEVYDILEPILGPNIAKVADAQDPELYNPNAKEIRIEMDPRKMAALQLVPRDVDKAVNDGLEGSNGGSVTVGTQALSIQMPRLVQNLDDIGRIVILTPSGEAVHLSDIAKIDFGPKTSGTQSFKTNGAPSVLLFASPKPGGNVKRMADDLMDVVKDTMKSLPKDIQYRVLVDPSEFIQNAVVNVLHEVAIGALLAVAILFLFIGSFKNVVTAAIEIPMSMVLAFILMRMSGMNLNLISLGGLALSAGMNVDGSVVVMENIFRHFDEAKKKAHELGNAFKPSPSERLDIVVRAVREVSFAVIASTVASLVVFLPLAFTSDLSYAILGDLAKTVVFSHGFSAFVALILVPTVRLQLMSRPGADEEEHHSPIEKQLSWLETAYGNSLRKFIENRKFQFTSYAGLAALLVVLTLVVLPRLPKEIIGKPDTDWMMLGLNTRGNTILRQMESQEEVTESQLLAKMGGDIQYTFAQVNSPNSAWIMARIKEKSKMKEFWKRLETEFTNTPFIRYWTDAWNPAELPIPDPPNLRIAVRGGELEERARLTEALDDALEEKQVYPRLWTQPDVGRREGIRLVANPEQWSAIGIKGQELYTSDIADIARVATLGRRVAYFMVNGRNTDVSIRYPENTVSTAEDIAALPVGIGSKLVPLKALADVRIEDAPASIYREDQRELFVIFGKESETADQSQKSTSASLKESEQIVNDYMKQRQKGLKPGDPRSQVTVMFEDAQKDMNEALHELSFAVGLSILLIFLTLMLQFGSLWDALLVLVAVPLGFIGVLVSLFVFRSTLSLNSVLGVILLNGIAVANSILLVDFLKRKVNEGMDPVEAAVFAGRTRLRPILITSLTTILGMLPVALGLGEGGRILQPLGVAVSGGLWVSMGLTLFIAPALQVLFLKRKKIVTRDLKRIFVLSGILLIAGMRVPSASADAPATNLLSFPDAIDEIVRRSTDVATQRDQVLETEAKNITARTAFLPNLSVQLSRYANQDNALLQRTDGDSLNILAKLNLFRFGADVKGWQAANGDEKSQSLKLAYTFLGAEQEAVQGLVDEIQQRLETEVLAGIVKKEQELLTIGSERYQRGLLPQQEVDKIEIDMENASARLADTQIKEAVAHANLVALLGHDRIQAEWPWIDRFREISSDPKKLASILGSEDDLSRRPDVESAISNSQAQSDRASQRVRQALPTLDSSVTYSSYGLITQNVGESLDPTWTAQLTITIPVFDQLSGYSAARVQYFEEQKADVALELARRNAMSDWTSAKETFTIALTTAMARQETVRISRKLYGDSRRRFRLGRVDANDLSLDERRLSESEILAEAGWAQAHLAFAQLCHSRGLSLRACLTESSGAISSD